MIKKTMGKKNNKNKQCQDYKACMTIPMYVYNKLLLENTELQETVDTLNQHVSDWIEQAQHLISRIPEDQCDHGATYMFDRFEINYEPKKIKQ